MMGQAPHDETGAISQQRVKAPTVEVGIPGGIMIRTRAQSVNHYFSAVGIGFAVGNWIAFWN
jgi:hypothetical protein